MGKRDPIWSEFDTDEDAQAYDAWFRAKVQVALNSSEAAVSHEEVMQRLRLKLPDVSDAQADLAR